PPKGKLTWNNLRGAAVMPARVVWHVGIKANYRRAYWRAAWYSLKKGQIDGAVGMAFIGHHLIEFTREALRGDQNASYYSTKQRTAPMAVAKPPARQDDQGAAYVRYSYNAVLSSSQETVFAWQCTLYVLSIRHAGECLCCYQVSM